MAQTDDRVPICLIYHNDPGTDLSRELAKAGLIAVDASDFDTLSSNCVRIRVPVLCEMDKVIAAVSKVNG